MRNVDAGGRNNDPLIPTPRVPSRRLVNYGRNKMFVVDSMGYVISYSIRISSDCLGICHFPVKERNVIERNYKQYDYKWGTR
jgi:hypothetical protein